MVSVYFLIKSKYHVLGNHDADSISKEQFLANIKNTNISDGSKYYSFDLKGLHFIVLDANYCADGSDYDHGNFSWTYNKGVKQYHQIELFDTTPVCC